jgi:hypothetical protein
VPIFRTQSLALTPSFGSRSSAKCWQGHWLVALNVSAIRINGLHDCPSEPGTQPDCCPPSFSRLSLGFENIG